MATPRTVFNERTTSNVRSILDHGMFYIYDVLWRDVDPATFAQRAWDFKYAGITHAGPQVWHENIGTIGWDSPLLTQDQELTDKDALTQYVAAMHDQGIMVDAQFRMCTQGTYTPFNDYGGGFCDVFDTDFQDWISDLVAGVVPLVDLVSLDYIRTPNDPPPGEDNATAVAEIVRKTYEKVGGVIPVACATRPYLDIESTTGRRAIEWLNAGIMDIGFDMNYGQDDGGDYGDPPDMDRVVAAQALVPDPRSIIAIGACYVDDGGFTSAPNSTFKKVVNALETDVYLQKALFDAVYLTRGHRDILNGIQKPRPRLNYLARS